MARLSVAVLGAPEVRHGGQPVNLPTRKALATLLYLLVEGGTHRRDKLVTFFWPESDEQAGRATLRSTLARLREGLADDDGNSHLLVERDAISFDVTSDFDLDLDDLRQAYDAALNIGDESVAGPERHELVDVLQRGSAVWRGEFLDGFLLRESPDFDDWASTQREVWHRRVVTVLDRLSLLQAEGGSTPVALETVERWLRLDPFEERAHRRLIQLHLAAGDRGAALRAYDACRTLLLDELGIHPEPETEALVARIHDSPTRPTQEPRRPERPTAPFVDVPIVGREDEFARLVGHFRNAAQGHPRAIVLQGEAGIGKTRLAGTFLDWAQAEGAEVLQGRSFESGARLPYQPLTDALRPRLEREADLSSLLSDTWLAELSRILPELRDRQPALEVPGGDEAVARTRLFEAIARLGRAFADRAPLVLFIDDVQWADVASLDVLRYAGRRWTQDEVPVLLLLNLRSEALGTTPLLADWLQGLRRDLDVAEIELGPLSFADTRRLLYGARSTANVAEEDETFASWIYEETSGQPFFVIETLRALTERGALVPHQDADGAWVVGLGSAPDPGDHERLLPAGVRRIVQDRLAPLPPSARDLLTTAAVLGQGFDFDLLCRVSQLDVDDALPALEAVVGARLLRETNGTPGDRTGHQDRDRYTFTHDKIRDVVYAEAGDARRRVVHRRALDALEEAGAPAAEVFRHALASGQDEAALRYAIAAGDAAMQLLATRDAAALYASAITLAERLGRDDLLGELHARRGRAFVSVAMWADARRELELALLRLPIAERDRRAEILVDLADACFWMMDVDAMRRHASDVLEIAAELGRGDFEAKALAWLATAEGSAGNLPTCVERNQVAIDRARSLGIRPPPVAYFRSMALYWLGRHGEAVDGIGEAVEIARDANDVSWTMWSLPNLGLALAGTGKYAAAEQAFEEARQLGRTYGAETLLARSLACSAGYRLNLLDFAGAEARSQEARELAKSLGFTPPAVSAGIDLLLNYARRGDAGQTRSLVEEVAEGAAQASGFHGWLWSLRLAQARAEIALAQANAEDALRWADDVITQCRARGRVKYEVLGLVTRGQAHRALGHESATATDFRLAVTLARPTSDPALLLRAISSLLQVEGDDELMVEGTALVSRIVAELPNADEQSRFEALGSRLLQPRPD